MAWDTSSSMDESQDTTGEREAEVYLPPEKYTVGWICALRCELKAARTMLDEEHVALRVQSEQDGNNYLLGRIGPHNVAITSLPQAGNNRGATAAKSMQTTFPNMKFCLMVGVGGGVPSKDPSWNDVRLGDIVVSEPTENSGGVIQYDMGKREIGGFVRRGTLNKPPGLLLAAMKTLHTTKNLSKGISDLVNDKLGDEEDPEEEWTYPKRAKDVLFNTDHYQTTKSTDLLVACGAALLLPATYLQVWREDYENRRSGFLWYLRYKPVRRTPRSTNTPRIHYGNIGSGNSVVKNAVERDELAKRDNVVCFEMEAAGIMDDFPCLVIRGISDYADSYKRWDWQPYAAAVAAAYGKKLLLTISPIGVQGMKAIGQIKHGVQRIDRRTKRLVRNQELQDEEKFLNWLAPIDHGSKHRDVLRQRQAETGQWVLESEKFQKWLCASKPETLLCPGMPGAGKTFIAATIIDHLQQRFRDDTNIAVVYIYCDFDRQNEQTADNLIATLVKQLARLRPGTLSRLYQDHQRNQTRPSWEEMLKTLHTVAATYTKIFLVVDAVDECQDYGTRKRFLQAIFDLQAQTRTNILGTSRHDTKIQQKFQNSAVLEIHARNQDIERYIDGNMHKLPDFVENNLGLCSKIKKEIIARVDGMFLLATLYLNLLIGQISENDLMEVSSMLPTGGKAYDETYDRCMERIERQIGKRRDLAKKLLAWVTCAERPLKESELEHALAVKIGQSSLDKGDIPQEMVEVCAGLVRIDHESREIRLVHFTTKEYFRRTQERWFPEAQYVIAMTCITYLGFDTFQSGICETEREMEARIRTNPFYYYAANYWDQHARHISQIQQDIALRFLTDSAKIEAYAQAMYATRNGRFIPWRDNRGKTGLHLVADCGLNNFAEILLQAGCELNTRDETEMTPLSIAATRGWTDIVRRLLMEKNVDVNAIDMNTRTPRTPLNIAAWQGHHSVVKKLLKHPAIEINFHQDSHGTALSIAAEKGHVETVNLLLKERNIDVNAREFYGQTALARAARAGKDEVVGLLLTAVDVDIDHVNCIGRTALMLASSEGNVAITKRLLEHGADWKKQCSFGKTALHVAAHGGHLEIVKLLATEKYRVILDIQDRDGRTALHLASWVSPWNRKRGKLGKDIVEILLANGADSRVKTFSGETAKDIAASRKKWGRHVQWNPARWKRLPNRYIEGRNGHGYVATEEPGDVWQNSQYDGNNSTYYDIYQQNTGRFRTRNEEALCRAFTRR
ncbi:ankyrin repeat protein [Fusarium flagelliforme]|uniref:Ankyrin repeat protein n=1 Tax=Fusarium flagelliforme TaxID=2675880 RepID=A0A395MGE6_9HYPO|nr:ankyrin repeat protein [Fusarium flagelliforme]